MARKKFVEPKHYYVLFCNGEQIIGTFYGDWEQARAAEKQANEEMAGDGLTVVAERNWTREELERMARADVAPSYILEPGFEWAD
jgi:hypothetical protein